MPARGLQRVARFAADASGNMAIMFAFAFLLTAVAAAFAVDEAALYTERRNLQRIVDLAALMAVDDPANGFEIARDVLEEADLVDASLSFEALTAVGGERRLLVEAGRYVADPSVLAELRFTVGATPTNAVRVRFQHPGTLYFANQWAEPPAIAAAAIAVSTPEVAFSVGSRLASLNGGVGNAVLNALLGSNVALTLADYNGLVGADVSLFGFLDALAQQMSVTAGTYDQLLAMSANHGQIARALEAVLSGAPRSAAARIGAATGHNGTLQLSSLIGLGSYGTLSLGEGSGQSSIETVPASEILAASAALGTGSHIATINLAAGVPSLTSLALTLTVGEPPQGRSWFAVGPANTIARTAQVRARFTAQLGGNAVLLNASLRVPLVAEIAYAEASVQQATCPTEAEHGSVTMLARPGIVRLRLGEATDAALSDFSVSPTLSQARLIDLALLRVTAAASAEVGNLSATALHFTPAEIENGTVETVSTATPTASLANSLLGSMTLGVTLGPLVLTPTALVDSTVRALVQPLGPVLDATLAAALEPLGIALGEADGRVYSAQCSRPVLVG